VGKSALKRDVGVGVVVNEKQVMETFNTIKNTAPGIDLNSSTTKREA